MVADFLSQMNERLPEEEVQEYLNKIPYPGVKAVLDNAIMPIKERAEQGVQPSSDCQDVCQEEMVGARPTRLATTNVTDWKLEQKQDPVLYQVVKHLRVPCETFKAALHKVLDKKATAAYVKVKEQLLIKNGLLYRKTRQGQADEIVFQFVVPQRHQSTTLDGCHQEATHQGQHRSTTLMPECFWWPGMTQDLRNHIKKCGCCRKYKAAPPVALQPGDIVMVCTDGFVGKWKVKDRWEDRSFIIKSQLEDWPIYRVKCPTSDDRLKPKYWILHCNRLLLVTNGDASDIPGQAQAEVTPTVSSATPETFLAGVSLLERLQPSLVT